MLLGALQHRGVEPALRLIAARAHAPAPRPTVYESDDAAAVELVLTPRELRSAAGARQHDAAAARSRRVRLRWTALALLSSGLLALLAALWRGSAG